MVHRYKIQDNFRVRQNISSNYRLHQISLSGRTNFFSAGNLAGQNYDDRLYKVYL